MGLTTKPVEYGFDSTVIRSFIDTIKGGVVLDVTDFPDDIVKAGHPIIVDAEQTTYKPLPVSENNFGSLPSGYKYCGVLISTISVEEPFAAVLTIGEVNDKLTPYPLTDEIKNAFKDNVPTINWAHD